MGIREGDMITLWPGIRGPGLDGAVAELTQEPDGTITAEIHIPGPPVP